MNENGGADDTTFGACCGELNEALTSEDFDPLITVGDDGVLYMSVGLLGGSEDEAGIVDHPIFFCPFCGTRLQTPEQVQAKAGPDEDE